MYYIAHYSCDAYYEPAEGGYYVETHQRDWYHACKSMKSARRLLKILARQYGYHKMGFKCIRKSKELLDGCITLEKRKNVPIMYADEEYIKSKYVGDGEFLVMERGWRAHAKGYQPYC